MPQAPNISRRTFAIGAIGACAMLGLGGVKYLPSQSTLRPPGGQDESHLFSACIHCEKCREACPHGAISPVNNSRDGCGKNIGENEFCADFCAFTRTDKSFPLPRLKHTQQQKLHCRARLFCYTEKSCGYDL